MTGEATTRRLTCRRRRDTCAKDGTATGRGRERRRARRRGRGGDRRGAAVHRRGPRAGIRPADLVGAITNEAGVCRPATWAIDIADSFSHRRSAGGDGGARDRRDESRGAPRQPRRCQARSRSLMNRREFVESLIAAAMLPGTRPGRGAAQTPAQRQQDRRPRPTLWYSRAAARWVEALPIGNGRLGAMVFGDVSNERLQVNDDTLWSGGPGLGRTGGARGTRRDPPADARRRLRRRPISCRRRMMGPSPSPICRSATSG